MVDHPLLDFVVVGASPGGLSVAAEAGRRGLSGVVVEGAPPRCWIVRSEGDERRAVVCAPPAGVGGDRLDAFIERWQIPVHYGEHVLSIAPADDAVTVRTSTAVYRTKDVVLAVPAVGTPLTPDFPLPASLRSRIHFDPFAVPADGGEVLVAGQGDLAADAIQAVIRAGHPVVFAAPHADPAAGMSEVNRIVVESLVEERSVTAFGQAPVVGIEDVGGYPMVRFGDPGLPELQFDHVVFALGTVVAGRLDEWLDIEITLADAEHLWMLGDVAVRVEEAPTPRFVREAGPLVLALVGAPLPLAEPGEDVEELRRRHYNATISWIEPVHASLWRFGVEPDDGPADYKAGQYGTLGLGYWEGRVDDVEERLDDERRARVVRRSYSVSSSVIDDGGFRDPRSLEFYVVLVSADDRRDHIPEFTPRLFGLKEGDRIYLGRRFAGRYTPDLAPAGSDIFLIGSGTGEAPHNRMLIDFLSRADGANIVHVVSVRYPEDLGYLGVHREIERRFPRYHYVPVVTREPGKPKTYIQDLVASGRLEEETGVALDPDTAHVFLCGNPLMIGAPEWEDDEPRFPRPVGVSELLYQRGFAIDRRGAVGNVHREEYW